MLLLQALQLLLLLLQSLLAFQLRFLRPVAVPGSQLFLRQEQGRSGREAGVAAQEGAAVTRPGIITSGNIVGF
jgi:hypothetical protein